MAKQIVYDEQARQALKKGVDALANAVRVTLGPKGRNVTIQKSYGSPQITKDGVTIAKEIELEDNTENLGTQLIKEAATKTVDTAGDGTTTSVVLAQAMISEGLKNVAAGTNPMEIKAGIEKGLKAVVKEINRSAKTIKGKVDLRKVATISANGDIEIGTILANIMEKVGESGVITVEEGQTFGLVEKYVDGMQFDKGYISPYFVTNSEKLTAEIEDANILLFDGKISAVKDMLPVIEKLVQSGSKNLVIIAEEVEGEALATLIVNKLKGIINVVAVKAPAFGDRRKAMMEDIAILTGGSLISEEIGKKIETAELADLGKADKVIVGKEETTIVNGKGNKKGIITRVEAIRKEIAGTESDYDKEKLQERLAKLTGGVAILQVGAATEVELKERKDRIEDALAATKAATEEGVVAGGGVTYLQVAEKYLKVFEVKEQGDKVSDSSNLVKYIGSDSKEAVKHESNRLNNGGEEVGVKILREALAEPTKAIAQNAGKEGSVIAEKIRTGEEKGYDARNNKFVDMIQAGIIDPAKVVRLALENAASVAMLLLTTEAVVVDIPEKEEPGQAGMGAGGMGGMM